MLYLLNLKRAESSWIWNIKKYRQEDIKVAGAIFKIANTRYTMVVC
jgi:hypothetical protein